MFRGILPQEVAFYDHFEKLAALNQTISSSLLSMVEGNKSLIETCHEIKKLEQEAEQITQTSIDLIHCTFLTPFNRDEIHQLVKGLDNFSDDIYAAIFRLAHYEINIIRPEAFEYAQIINSCTIEIESAIKGLRKIKKKEPILKSCAIVHELELKSDLILHNAILKLYQQEDIPVVIKWKEVFERFERAVDHIEKVAFIIESIVLNN